MNEHMDKALKIVAEWNAKSGEERYNFCRNCVLKGIREGRRLAHGDELGDAINTTYEIVAGKLMDADKLAENIKRQANKGFTDSLAGIVSRAVKATLQREIDRGKRDRPARHDLHTRLFLWHYWTQSKIFVASTSPAPLWEEHALLLSTSW